MDDCSPDNTGEVANSFHDPRVRHIRNQDNLGHLQNYNKGIALSQGKYIWLISADDRLCKPYVLERYLRVMERNPRVGYACCPAIKLEKGIETEVEGRLDNKDTIFDGTTLLARLLKGNCIPAASGMVRRTCYEQCGSFPLDLPYAGDWYLWCLFALHFDAAYFSEPMVNYRAHELSMTSYLLNHRLTPALEEGLTVLWRMRDQARQIGNVRIVKHCTTRLGRLYGSHLVGGVFENHHYRMSEEDLEISLNGASVTAPEANWIRARIWMAAGDCSFRLNDFANANRYYRRALQYHPWLISVRLRQMLLSTGDLGIGLTKTLLKIRRVAFN
jgi:glycosyltransferase involved in cell wall biosynthesis